MCDTDVRILGHVAGDGADVGRNGFRKLEKLLLHAGTLLMTESRPKVFADYLPAIPARSPCEALHWHARHHSSSRGSRPRSSGGGKCPADADIGRGRCALREG